MKCFVWLAVLMVLSAINGLPTETALNDYERVPDAGPHNSVAPDIVPTQGEQDTVERGQVTGGDFEQFKYFNDVERNVPEESQQVLDASPLNSDGPDEVPTQGEQETVENRPNNARQFEQFKYLNGARNAKYNQNAQSYLQKETGSRQSQKSKTFQKKAHSVMSDNEGLKTQESSFRSGDQANTNEENQRILASTQERGQSNTGDYRRNLRLGENHGRREENRNSFTENHSKNINVNNGDLREIMSGFQSAQNSGSRQDFSQLLRSEDEYLQNGASKTYRKNLSAPQQSDAEYQESGHQRLYNYENKGFGVLGQRGYKPDRLINGGYQGSAGPLTHRRDNLEAPIYYKPNNPSILKQGLIDTNLRYHGNYDNKLSQTAEIDHFGTEEQRFNNQHNIGPIRHIDNGFTNNVRYPNEDHNRNQYKSQLNIESEFEKNTKKYVSKAFNYANDAKQYAKEIEDEVNKEINVAKDLKYVGNTKHQRSEEVKIVNSATDVTKSEVKKTVENQNASPYQPDQIVPKKSEGNANTIDEISQFLRQNRFKGNVQNYYRKVPNHFPIPSNIVNDGPRYYRPPNGRYINSPTYEDHGNIIPDYGRPINYGVNPFVGNEYAPQSIPNAGVNGAPGYMTSPSTYHEDEEDLEEVNNVYAPRPFQRYVPHTPIFDNHKYRKGPVYKNSYYRDDDVRVVPVTKANTDGTVPTTIIGTEPKDNKFILSSISPVFVNTPENYKQTYLPENGGIKDNEYILPSISPVISNTPEDYKQTYLPENGGIKDNEYILPSISPVISNTPEDYKQTYLPENGGIKDNEYILPSISPVIFNTPEDYKQTYLPENGGIKANKYILPSISPVNSNTPEEYKQAYLPENGGTKGNKYLLPSISPVFVNTPEDYKQTYLPENGGINNVNDKTLNPNTEGSIDDLINRKNPNRYSGLEYNNGRTSPAIINEFAPSVEDFRKPKVISPNNKLTLISKDLDTSNLVVNNENNAGKDTPDGLVNNDVKPKDVKDWNAPAPMFDKQNLEIIDEKDIDKLPTVSNDLSLKKGNKYSLNNGKDIIKQNTESREIDNTPTDNTYGSSLPNKDVIKKDAESSKLKEILPIYYTEKSFIDIVDVNDNSNKPEASLSIKNNDIPAEKTDDDDLTEKNYNDKPDSLSGIIDDKLVNPKKTGDDLITEIDDKTSIEPTGKPFDETDDDYLSNDVLKPDTQDDSKPDGPLNNDKIVEVLEKTDNDIPLDKNDVTSTEIKKSSESIESSDGSTVISKKHKIPDNNKAKKTIDAPEGSVTSHTNKNNKALPADVAGDSNPASYNNDNEKSSIKTDNSDVHADGTDLKDDDESGKGSSNVKPTEKSAEDDLLVDNDVIKPAVDSINNENNKPEITDKDDDSNKNGKNDDTQKDDKAANIEELTLIETKKSGVSTENSEDTKSANRKHKKKSKKTKTKTRKPSKKSDDTNPSNGKDVTSIEINKSVSSENTESSNITKKSHKKKHSKKSHTKKAKKSKITEDVEPFDKKDAVKGAKDDIIPNDKVNPSKITGEVEPIDKVNDRKPDVELNNNKDPSKNNDVPNPSDKDKDSNEDVKPSNKGQETPAEKTEGVKPNDKKDNDQESTVDKYSKQDAQTNDNKIDVHPIKTDDTKPSNEKEDSGKYAETTDNTQVILSKKTDLTDKVKKYAESSNNNDIISIPNKVIDRKPRRKHKSKKNDNARSTDNEKTKNRKHKKKSRNNKTRNVSPSKIGQESDGISDAESGNDVGKSPKRKHKKPKKNKKLTPPKTTDDTDSKDKDDNTNEIKPTPNTQDENPKVTGYVIPKNGDVTKEIEDKANKDSNSNENNKLLNINDDKITEKTNANNITDLDKTKTTETDTSDLQKSKKRTKNKDGKKDETGQGNKDQDGDSKEVRSVDSIDCDNDSDEPKSDNSKESKALKESSENKKKVVKNNKRLKLRKIKYKIFKNNNGNTNLNSKDQTEILENKHGINRPKHIKKYKVPLTLKRRIISRHSEKKVNGEIEIESKKTNTETTEVTKSQEKGKDNKNSKDHHNSKSSEEVDCDESEE